MHRLVFAEEFHVFIRHIRLATTIAITSVEAISVPRIFIYILSSLDSELICKHHIDTCHICTFYLFHVV